MKDGVAVEIAMQHNDSYSENTYGFVNNITTPEGGTHIEGFRGALTKTFNDYARKNKLLKDSEPIFRRRYQRRAYCNRKREDRRSSI